VGRGHTPDLYLDRCSSTVLYMFLEDVPNDLFPALIPSLAARRHWLSEPRLATILYWAAEEETNGATDGVDAVRRHREKLDSNLSDGMTGFDIDAKLLIMFRLYLRSVRDVIDQIITSSELQFAELVPDNR
jgi:hypothetical protein